jgi:hypothetical protein
MQRASEKVQPKASSRGVETSRETSPVTRRRLQPDGFSNQEAWAAQPRLSQPGELIQPRAQQP